MNWLKEDNECRKEDAECNKANHKDYMERMARKHEAEHQEHLKRMDEIEYGPPKPYTILKH